MTTTRCSGCGDEIGETRKAESRYCETCETVTVHEGFTRAELKDAFERVQDASHWKNPINRVIAGNTSKRDRAMIAAAVVFYAGCTASIEKWGNKYRVTAVGYYAAVGA